MSKINIFKDVGKYDFNYYNLRLDLVSKMILKESIQQQYNEFVEFIKIPLSTNDWSKYKEEKYDTFIRGIFSTNPLEHCLINYLTHPKNGLVNKYNCSGLIIYLINIGFTADINYVKSSAKKFNPQIDIDPYDYYLMKLNRH